MDANEAIRRIIKASGKSGRQVAREIGRSESFVSSSLAQGVCPRADTLAHIADVCGYELIIVPKRDASGLTGASPGIVIEYDSRERSARKASRDVNPE